MGAHGEAYKVVIVEDDRLLAVDGYRFRGLGCTLLVLLSPERNQAFPALAGFTSARHLAQGIGFGIREAHVASSQLLEQLFAAAALADGTESLHQLTGHLYLMLLTPLFNDFLAAFLLLATDATQHGLHLITRLGRGGIFQP